MQLSINQLAKSLAGKPVLQDLNLELEEGSIACLLGASGCGKTTLLRCIAGFESIESGCVKLNDEVVAATGTHVAPHDRGVGMVFQDHALFPHLSVAQNTAFGLHRWNQDEASQRVTEVLALVGLSSHANRYPHELSGGQQQRAALARALATKPRLLLLDEPFASLDRELRYRLVQDVSAILRASNTTALWVTHDAREALQAADTVGVMNNGHIVQWDTPANLYERPASPEVAAALGDCTLLQGVVQPDGLALTALGVIAVDSREPLSEQQSVLVLVRPEQLKLIVPHAIDHNDNRSDDQVNAPRRKSEVSASLKYIWFHGVSTVCTVVLPDGTEVKVAAGKAPELAAGATTLVAWNTAKTIAFAT